MLYVRAGEKYAGVYVHARFEQPRNIDTVVRIYARENAQATNILFSSAARINDPYARLAIRSSARKLKMSVKARR